MVADELVRLNHLGLVSNPGLRGRKNHFASKVSGARPASWRPLRLVRRAGSQGFCAGAGGGFKGEGDVAKCACNVYVYEQRTRANKRRERRRRSVIQIVLCCVADENCYVSQESRSLVPVITPENRNAEPGKILFSQTERLDGAPPFLFGAESVCTHVLAQSFSPGQQISRNCLTTHLAMNYYMATRGGGEDAGGEPRIASSITTGSLSPFLLSFLPSRLSRLMGAQDITARASHSTTCCRQYY